MPFSTFRTAMTRLWSWRNSTKATGRQRRLRLLIEQLEDRFALANNHGFTGLNGTSWGDPMNWSHGHVFDRAHPGR